MRLRLVPLLLIVCLFAPVTYARLTADQLLLVVNKNLPDSVDLAKHYAQVRGVPAERILELDLPATEQILPDEYEKRIASPVRAYLATPNGATVKCVTLFYGVPLQVRGVQNDEPVRLETTQLKKLLGELDKRSAVVAQAMEEAARTLGVTPRVISGQGTQFARLRVESTARQIQAYLQQHPDAERRKTIEASLLDIQKQMAVAARESMDAVYAPAPAQSTTQQTPQTPTTTPADGAAPIRVDPAALQKAMADPLDRASRETARKLGAEGGVFVLHQIVDQQLTWISGEESDASVDSELALVHWPAFPKFRWIINPLHYSRPAAPNPGIMTARIDAPTPQLARRLIDDAIDVEKRGLTGVAVFDSRGLLPKKGNAPDNYFWYDQLIRDAAKFVSEQTQVKVVTDDRTQVILPHTVDNVALYVGWYSLQNYVPGFTLNQGSVAYHVASLELTSMRKPNTKEWVPNLIKDGACATLGAVSEPYLHSFPRPEEFFPILLTGEYTLAETYWLTCPMTSWKIILVGDPLYRPYATNPALKIDGLPVALRTALGKIEGTR